MSITKFLLNKIVENNIHTSNITESPEMNKNTVINSVEELHKLAKEGKIKPNPDNISKCYAIAFKTVLKNPELLYVIGKIYSPKGKIWHAWCVDKDNNVYEPMYDIWLNKTTFDEELEGEEVIRLNVKQIVAFAQKTKRYPDPYTLQMIHKITEARITYLYHVTPKTNIKSILENGLNPGTYLAIDQYHAKNYANENHKNIKDWVLLKIDTSMLDSKKLYPDDVDFPTMDDDWRNKSWMDSLTTSGQCRYEGRIKKSAISIVQNIITESSYYSEYGFWIDEKGQVYEVDFENHYYEAENIINNKSMEFYPIQYPKFLHNKGWIRVVYSTILEPFNIDVDFSFKNVSKFATRSLIKLINNFRHINRLYVNNSDNEQDQHIIGHNNIIAFLKQMPTPSNTTITESNKEILLERNVINIDRIKNNLNSILATSLTRLRSDRVKSWFNTQLIKYIINRYGINDDHENNITKIIPNGFPKLLLTTQNEIKYDTTAIVDNGYYIKELDMSLPKWAVNKLKHGEELYYIIFDNGLIQNIDLVIDYLIHLENRNPNIDPRMQWEDAVRAAQIWHDELMNSIENNPGNYIQEDLTTVLQLDNGFKWVLLDNEVCLSNEGKRMGHCVAGYSSLVENGETKIYSLRDSKNYPHVTIEITRKVLRQIKGKFNTPPNKKYVSYITDFLNKFYGNAILNISYFGIEDCNSCGINMGFNLEDDGSIIFSKHKNIVINYSNNDYWYTEISYVFSAIQYNIILVLDNKPIIKLIIIKESYIIADIRPITNEYLTGEVSYMENILEYKDYIMDIYHNSSFRFTKAMSKFFE